MSHIDTQRKSHYLIAGLLGVTVLVWGLLISHKDQSGQLEIHFLDVGQGDAIFIESPTGQQVLVDGGAGKSVVRQLSSVMPIYDRSIDMVVGTHADKDHIGGLTPVFARYQVSAAVTPALDDIDKAHAAALANEIRIENAAQIHPKSGQVFNIGGGAYLYVFFPDRLMRRSGNTQSAVMQLRYRNTKVLLTGDIPDEVEMYLSQKVGQSLQSDILKVSHHGSDSSSAQSFLEAVDPTYAVVQAGADNSYGHPAEVVLERLKQVGGITLCTCSDGTITFETDGYSITHLK